MSDSSLFRDKILPIGTVVLAIIAIWYAAAVFLNAPFERDQAERAKTTISFSEILPRTMAQERPVLPAPHQVFTELWDTTIGKKITSKRSLVYHSWITLSSTLLGFLMGTVLGVALAVGIVHFQTLDRQTLDTRRRRPGAFFKQQPTPGRLHLALVGLELLQACVLNAGQMRAGDHCHGARQYSQYQYRDHQIAPTGSDNPRPHGR